MNLQDNIRFDTLTSRKLSFVQHGGELFRPVVHPETGDTVFIDGIVLPLPKETTVNAFDTIQPCTIAPLGDTRLASEFIELPEKLQPIKLRTKSEIICNDVLFSFVAVVLALYVFKSYQCWVEFGSRMKAVLNS
jgi:hypothetical protein